MHFKNLKNSIVTKWWKEVKNFYRSLAVQALLIKKSKWFRNLNHADSIESINTLCLCERINQFFVNLSDFFPLSMEDISPFQLIQ